jgi:hypothetical protein
MYKFRGTILVAALAALSGCGGGGGSAPGLEVPTGVRNATPSAAADLRADNVDTFVGPMARVVLTSGSGVLLDPIGGRDVGPSGAGRGHAALLAPTLVGGTLRHWLRHLSPAMRRHVLELQFDEQPCSFGGSIVVGIDDADGNQRLSAGDVITFGATACVEDPSLPAIDGGFAMTINAVELDSDGEPTALDVSANFLDFTLAGYGRLHGAFRLWLRDETVASTRLRISYLSTNFTDAEGTSVYDFDVDGLVNAATGSFELGGGIILGGQTYALASTARIGYAVDANPSTGELRLRDAAGDELRLVPRSASSFDLEYWSAGAAQPALVLNDLLWDDYTD